MPKPRPRSVTRTPSAAVRAHGWLQESPGRLRRHGRATAAKAARVIISGLFIVYTLGFLVCQLSRPIISSMMLIGLKIREKSNSFQRIIQENTK
jgi:hypothetical protein